jgi:5-formyltetrahydrofolate cyclo-ligase
MLKREIRKIYSEKRQSLSTDQFFTDSEKIVELFKGINWAKKNVLMSYYAIPDRKEFNVADGEEVLRQQHPSIVIAHPRIIEDDKNMEAVIIDRNTHFSFNRYHIAEPVNGEVISPEKIDMIFVPLLAFDQLGYRVGYGKGYYDRYISRCRPDVLKVGFSFFEPIPAIEDINQFDVPLSLCITPMRVYEF